jgi:membrane-bound serine protease (ClpP class)
MQIGDRIMEIPDRIHVVAWIPKEAYSGAALVSMACDEIVMGRDAHLGDAQPITIGAEGIKPVGEKMESPLRAKFRAYAQRNGHPVALAEAMVSARVEVLRVRDPKGELHLVRGQDYLYADDDALIVDGYEKKDLVQVGPPVVHQGELLTFTAKEAAEYGFLDRTFEDGSPFPRNEAALLDALAAPGARIEKVGLSSAEMASRWLLGLSGVLAAAVALGLLVTFWQGVGTMTFVGAGALVLVILINATADQLNGFPVFLIALGALLMAVEIYLIPGFGVAGILGIAALGAGFLFLALGVAPGGSGEFSFDRDRTGAAVDFGLQFVVTVLAGLGLLVLAARYFPSLGPGRRLMLAVPASHPASVATSRLAPGVALGARGVATSKLRPAGSAEIDGRTVDVLTLGEYVDAGTPVEVIGVEGTQVTVRPARETT